MKEAITVAGTIAFILAICYLTSMARLASLLSKETRLEGVGIGGANAQMKLLGVVFLSRGLDPDFASRHRVLLSLTRWAGGIGLLLVLLVSAGIMLGYAG
ncbi:hypothetical protein [Luteibacter sp. ME-Dv--P-043b]|uniref:hypothetical protein n=1 Tax=Luteibacter sp. ME-Dv--P-043b TaxID=3040291 RepID=UPI0025525B7B|nr:hypothetical protein [Luteibacter sp. ME-Dv--P-043b]